MLTREAFALYAARLAPGGVLALHISNRFLNLGGVIAATAEAAGFTGAVQLFTPTPEQARQNVGASEWAVLAPHPASLTPLLADPRWKPLATRHGVPAWTDSYSNIFAAMR